MIYRRLAETSCSAPALPSTLALASPLSGARFLSIYTQIYSVFTPCIIYLPLIVLLRWACSCFCLLWHGRDVALAIHLPFVITMHLDLPFIFILPRMAVRCTAARFIATVLGIFLMPSDSSFFFWGAGPGQNFSFWIIQGADIRDVWKRSGQLDRVSLLLL